LYRKRGAIYNNSNHVIRPLVRYYERWNEKISESQKVELDLRKKTRELESKKEELELEVARIIDEERENIENEAFKQFPNFTQIIG